MSIVNYRSGGLLVRSPASQPGGHGFKPKLGHTKDVLVDCANNTWPSWNIVLAFPIFPFAARMELLMYHFLILLMYFDQYYCK